MCTFEADLSAWGVASLVAPSEEYLARFGALIAAHRRAVIDRLLDEAGKGGVSGATTDDIRAQPGAATGSVAFRFHPE